VEKAPVGVSDIRVSLQKGASVEIDWIGFDAVPWPAGAFETRKYRNFFAEMGYSQAEIDAKLEEVFNDVFYGVNKVYFEVGDSMAYISDLKNHDVRTEGMSYGMMIAVQFDRKDIFDRLWRWCKKYMQHQKGMFEGYFAWSCQTDGTRNSEGPASDGELYYVTSLIFASNRWGNESGINYLAEAQNILDCSMKKVGKDAVTPFINIEHQLITFTPTRFGAKFTDPSYHLPAFYEVWARWAYDGRSRFWRECAERSREYLHKSIHPVTGLNPDYNNYDGSLLLDVGGAHGKASGLLEFGADSTVTPYVSSNKNTDSNDTMVYKGYGSGETTKTVNYNGQPITFNKKSTTKTLKKQSTHTLTMFYMERGMWESNMAVAFNFPDHNELQVEKQVDVSDVNPLFQESFKNQKIFTFNIQNLATHYEAKATDEPAIETYKLPDTVYSSATGLLSYASSLPEGVGTGSAVLWSSDKSADLNKLLNKLHQKPETQGPI
jgi:endo-1,4-beta-D-glucanase Y